MVKKKVAELDVQEFAVKDLKPHPRNPRVHPEVGSLAWQVMTTSLSYDMFDPIVVNLRNGYIVSGHFRTKVIVEEKLYTHVKCIVKDYDEPTHIARMIAANKQAGEFIQGQLKDLLVEIDTGAMEMDLTGFDEQELVDILVPDYDPDAPDPLGDPGIEGDDTRLDRFILVYTNDEEKQWWMDKLGIDGSKVTWSITDILGELQ